MTSNWDAISTPDLIRQVARMWLRLSDRCPNCQLYEFRYRPTNPTDPSYRRCPNCELDTFESQTLRVSDRSANRALDAAARRAPMLLR